MIDVTAYIKENQEGMVSDRDTVAASVNPGAIRFMLEMEKFNDVPIIGQDNKIRITQIVFDHETRVAVKESISEIKERIKAYYQTK